MRRYLLSLIVVMLLMVAAAFAMLWFAPQHFIVAMPFLALYFGLITGIEHYIVVRSLNRSPRAFVQVFLGSTVALLIIHLVVLTVYLLTNTSTARPFLVAFCIGYVVTLVFETVSLVRYVNSERQRRIDQKENQSQNSESLR